MTRGNTPDEGGEEQAGRRVRTSRRGFLEATGVAGLVGGVGGFAMAQQQPATTYEFGGEVSGWQGQAPSDVEGETNPPLELEAGTEYEVVWENLDGQAHDFVIRDENGEELVGTDVVSEQGATTSFTFTASEEMAQYVCTIHPSSMVGDVVVGEGGGTPTESQDGAQEGFVPQGPTVGAQLVASEPLVNPVTLRTVPGMAGANVIVDQVGQVYLHQDGELQDDPVLDLSDRVVFLEETSGGFDRPEGFDERGLLGLAFHPDFQENGRFYVRYSAPRPRGDDGPVGPGDRGYPEDWDHIEVLSEFQMADDDTQFQMDPDSERILLEIPSPQFNHNGGGVTFGPDGYLYTSIGDGGDGNDTGVGHVEDWYDENEGGNGQDVTENLLGSVLRIDVDQEGDDRPYAVPDDNPLVDTDGYDEIYAWGLRNPWRMSFNDGMLVAADVGQARFEEVDVIQNGGNYGWNVREGFHCFNADNATEPLSECPTTAPDEPPFDGQELVDPVLEYPHTYQGMSVGISVTGGYVYQGQELSELSDRYVFGDWSSNFTQPQGSVYVATPDGGDGEGTPVEEGQTDDEGGVNATAGNETGDDVENATVGQGSGEDGNVTNQTGNETGGDDTTEAPGTGVDVQQPSEQPWPFEEVTFEGGENGALNRFVQGFGRDADGNLYVLASRTGRLTREVGEVYRLVPAGEGDEIVREVSTPELVGEGGEANETTGAENETAGVETATETETEEG